MATNDELSNLVNRRKAASAARQAQKEEPVVEDNPAPLSPTDPEREADKAAAIARATGATTPLARPSMDLSRQLDQRDMVMPKLKMSQGLSAVNRQFATSGGKSGVPMGNWYRTPANNNLGPTVYVVPLDFFKHRSKFEQGKGVTCRSFDLVQGVGDPGILCEGTEDERYMLKEDDRGCPFRLWRTDDNGKRIKPPCEINFNYPVLLLNSEDLEKPGSPCLLTLRSTGAASAKMINTLATDGQFIDPIWHESILKLTIEERSNALGPFSFALVEKVGSPSGAVAEQAAKLAEQLSPTMLRRTIETDDND